MVRGAGFLKLAMEQPLHAAPEAGLFFVSAEDAGEIFNFDHKGVRGERPSGLGRGSSGERQQSVGWLGLFHRRIKRAPGRSFLNMTKPAIIQHTVADQALGEAADIS